MMTRRKRKMPYSILLLKPKFFWSYGSTLVIILVLIKVSLYRGGFSIRPKKRRKKVTRIELNQLNLESLQCSIYQTNEIKVQEMHRSLLNEWLAKKS